MANGRKKVVPPPLTPKGRAFKAFARTFPHTAFWHLRPLVPKDSVTLSIEKDKGRQYFYLEKQELQLKEGKLGPHPGPAANKGVKTAPELVIEEENSTDIIASSDALEQHQQGMLCFQQQKLNEAVKHFEEALRLESVFQVEHGLSSLKIAKTKLETRRYNLAVSLYHREINSKNKRHFEETIKEFERAYETLAFPPPNGDQARQDLGHIRKAIVNRLEKYLDESHDLNETFKKIDEAYLKLTHLSALTDDEKKLSHKNRQYNIMTSLTKVGYKLWDVEKSLFYFNRAYEVAKNTSELDKINDHKLKVANALWAIGVQYKKAGDYQSALKKFFDAEEMAKEDLNQVGTLSRVRDDILYAQKKLSEGIHTRTNYPATRVSTQLSRYSAVIPFYSGSDSWNLKNILSIGSGQMVAMYEWFNAHDHLLQLWSYDEKTSTLKAATIIQNRHQVFAYLVGNILIVAGHDTQDFFIQKFYLDSGREFNLLMQEFKQTNFTPNLQLLMPSDSLVAVDNNSNRIRVYDLKTLTSLSETNIPNDLCRSIGLFSWGQQLALMRQYIGHDCYITPYDIQLRKQDRPTYTGSMNTLSTCCVTSNYFCRVMPENIPNDFQDPTLPNDFKSFQQPRSHVYVSTRESGYKYKFSFAIPLKENVDTLVSVSPDSSIIIATQKEQKYVKPYIHLVDIHLRMATEFYLPYFPRVLSMSNDQSLCIGSKADRAFVIPWGAFVTAHYIHRLYMMLFETISQCMPASEIMSFVDSRYNPQLFSLGRLTHVEVLPMINAYKKPLA